MNTEAAAQPVVSEHHAGEPAAKIPPIRRSWGTLLRNLPKLITYPLNPFRLSRSQMMLEVSLSLAGPRMGKELKAYLATPEGQQRMNERSDLCALLDDHERLAALPDGTLGREYLRFVSEMSGAPAEESTMAGAASFLELLKLEEVTSDLGWPEEAKWFIGRVVLTHDLTHVFTGYGPDNAGEFANIAYSAGHTRQMLLYPIVIALTLFTKPQQGRRAWIRYMWSAFNRGTTQREKLTLLDYESLLERPLSEVLEHIGIQPFEEAHPEGRIYDDLGWPNVNDTIMHT